jgi:hypothetical protein
MLQCIICQEPGVSEKRAVKYKTCPRCQSNINGWTRRTTAEVLQRQHNLEIYTTRMSLVRVRSNVVPIRKRNNVVTLKRRRA